jgi:hypothetical protein
MATAGAEPCQTQTDVKQELDAAIRTKEGSIGTPVVRLTCACKQSTLGRMFDIQNHPPTVGREMVLGWTL